MPTIVLTREQALAFVGAEEPVRFIDAAGNQLVTVDPDFRPESAEETREPSFSTRPVADSLRALRLEVFRNGEMTKERLREFMRRYHAGEI